MDLSVALFPIIKLCLVLMIIVFLMSKDRGSVFGFFIGAVGLNLLFPTQGVQIGNALQNGLFGSTTLSLLGIMVGIMVFTSALKDCGQIQRIVGAFESLVGGSRLSLVTFPALIGLLPMPGGALFSAPMVEAAVEGSDLESDRKVAANYWFRHIWEYWFPLYPGVILAMELTGISAGSFILFQLPMTLVALALGYFWILRGVRLTGTSSVKHPDNKNALFQFLIELIPILLVLVVVFSSVICFALLERLGHEAPLWITRLPVILGAVLATLWLICFRNLKAHASLLFQKSIGHMVLMILGLMVFKSSLEKCGAIVELQNAFDALHIPLFLVVMLLPFISGIITGIAIGYVGISFPLIMALISALPVSEQLPWIFLAYAMGHCGMMLSPVHICLVASNKFFDSKLAKVYRFLIPVIICMIPLICLLFVFYRG